MLAPFRGFKASFERITGTRIYRNTLPQGVSVSFDIHRALGRDGVRTVFDIGANIGQSALIYLSEFPNAQIYCFEPVAATYQRLRARTTGHSRIHTFNTGMGSEPGRESINVNPNDQKSSIKLRRSEDHSEAITLDTIADFADRHKIDTIDFLKVDTEEYDLDVLAGAEPLLKEQKIHFVQSECEPFTRTREYVSFPALTDFLRGFKYELFGVYEQYLYEDERVIRFWNAVFICNKLVPPGTAWPSKA
jgi:FkbM family methyltransferase